jgi:hypothetical protein
LSVKEHTGGVRVHCEAGLYRRMDDGWSVEVSAGRLEGWVLIQAGTKSRHFRWGPKWELVKEQSRLMVPTCALR